MTQRAITELSKTQGQRQGAEGTYAPDEVAAFELGAKYAMDLLYSRIGYSSETPAWILREMQRIILEKDIPAPVTDKKPLENLQIPQRGRFQQGGLNE